MSRKGRVVWSLLLALALGALPASAAVVQVQAGAQNLVGVNLGTAQTGNVDTTNTVDRGDLRGACLLKITNTAGAGPTVTVNILGSMDGTNFFNVGYAASATPETVAVAALTITSATTGYYILRPSHPWRYLKLTYSSNTNETLTADIWCSR